MSDRYTHGHHESVLRVHSARTAQNSASYLAPHLKPGTEILDVGSGPGTITADFAELVAPAWVTGVDASADVVDQAQALARDRGLANLSFRVGDAYALDVPDGSVDVVHAHQVLQHVSRPVDVLREFRRVVRPDGIVAARDVDYEGVVWFPRVPALDEWLDVYVRVHRGVGGEPGAGRALKSWARAAGFAEVESSASLWLFESDEERAWWGGAWAERAVASAFADHARELGIADDVTLERIADGWREWADSADGWLLMPHAEIIARG